IMVDANGQIVDGDGLLAVLAVGMKERDVLTDDTIVVTRLSNSGLWTRLREDDIRVAVTDVGDHHVAERLQRRGWALGGEPCGHIIIPKLFPSSDGILTAMKVMSIMVESGASLADLAHFDRIPQSHIN
ncbi:hypothetical protein NR514_27160, partial [Escherichia coli]|nr:hypothetical protein [Escherichia coli]